MNESQILLVLDKLSIKRERDFQGRHLQILCPNHNDKSFGSCQVYTNTVVKCWSCGFVSNLFGVVRKLKPELSSKQIFEFLGEKKESSLLANYLEERKLDRIKETKQIYLSLDKVERLKKEEVDSKLHYPFTRYMTKEFCDRFDIKIITEGFYKDFFCIPIRYNGQIISYEFRKAKEMEYFRQYYKDSKQKFAFLENYRKQFKLDLEENKVPKNFLTNYLRKSKVLYTKQSNLKEIIFNIDNLDRDKDLYICEGIAGISKIQVFNKTKNVTALFGSNISFNQVYLLLGFKQRKILVLDNDLASDKLVTLLNDILSDFWVFDSYRYEIKGSNYLLEKSGILENFHIL